MAILNSPRFLNRFCSAFYIMPLLVVGFTATSPTLAASQHTDMAEDNIVPYVLTISGGVSLGAYEAGLNWALLNYFKLEQTKASNGQMSPRLSTVTGASAGSINGLLTAIAWCVDEDKVSENSTYHGTVNDNLFKEIWVDVGLDGLLPKDTSQYGKFDGLFSRIPFDKPLDKVRAILSEDIFVKNCQIPLGITVTSETPRTIQISGITVNNQRHFIPVLLKTNDDGTASFYSYPVDETNTNFGNVIYLPSAQENTTLANYPIKLESVINSVLASSAFPVAFGRIAIDYCNPSQLDVIDNKSITIKAVHHCAEGHKAQSGMFVDGGVFDNVPLGSAMALAEEHRQGSQRRLNYIFMDPDNRRKATDTASNKPAGQITNTMATETSSITFNLVEQLAFIGGAILTARNYELYKVLTSGNWTNQTFNFSSQIDKAIQLYAKKNGIKLLTVQSTACPAFFSTLIQNNSPAINATWLSEARHCLLIESQALDFNYQYTPATNNTLLKNRESLINKLSLISEALNEHKLNNHIQRSKLDPLGDRRILLSSRFYPLTGAYLGAFGAFFDRPFRELDYYVGIYDGITDIVNYACQFRRTDKQSQCDTGLLTQQLYRDFHIDADPNARYVFIRIARLEYPQHINADNSWHWLAAINIENVNKETALLFDALYNNVDETQVIQKPDFNEFVKTLTDNKYTSENSSDFFKYIAEKDKDWWVLPSIRAADRLYKLEDEAEEGSEKKSQLKRPLALAAYISHHFDDGGKLITFDQPSTASSNSFLRFLPYEIGMRANHERTPYISWEPTLEILGKELLHIKLTPYHLDTKEDDAKSLYQISTMYQMFNSDLLNFGVAFDINGSWRERQGYDRVTAGLSLSTEIKKKIRLTFGVYDFYDHFAEYNFYFNIGLTDIPGYF